MFNKLHWLGYTESYSETQNYKYCILSGKNGDFTSDTSDMLGTIVEETKLMIRWMMWLRLMLHLRIYQ